MEFYIHIVFQSDVDKDQQDKEWPPKKQQRIAVQSEEETKEQYPDTSSRSTRFNTRF